MYNECCHLFPNGHKCGSPAMRDREHCYFHDPSRQPRQRDRRRYPADELRHAMAVALRDPGNIQQMLSAVILALAEDRIGVYKAQTLLHALQLASSLNGNNLDIIPMPPDED